MRIEKSMTRRCVAQKQNGMYSVDVMRCVTGATTPNIYGCPVNSKHTRMFTMHKLTEYYCFYLQPNNCCSKQSEFTFIVTNEFQLIICKEVIASHWITANIIIIISIYVLLLFHRFVDIAENNKKNLLNSR